jgi:hypothetical protein
MQVGNGHINQFDPQKWRNHAAEAVDQQVLA